MEFIVNKNIQRILRQVGEKQCAVADRTGLGRKVFSNICRCKRKVYADEVIPIAQAMGVTIEALFDEGVSA